MAPNINFDDPYVKKIVRHFTKDPFPAKPHGSSLRQLLPEEAEFHLASIYDSQIGFGEHNTFIEALQKVAENILECVVGFDTTYKECDVIGTMSLEKTLSQLFLAGHQACENRLKGKWKTAGTKNIKDSMAVYKVSFILTSDSRTPPAVHWDSHDYNREQHLNALLKFAYFLENICLHFGTSTGS